MKFLLVLVLLCAPAGSAWARAGGGGGGGCFAAGTLVATTAGDTIIEALRPGDMVLAYSDNGLLQVPVKEFYKKRARLLTLTAAKAKVVTTAEHPFLTRHGFVEAGTLKAGGEVGLLQDGRLTWVRIKRLKYGQQTDVYNLEVAPPHTFIANGFVVHNKGGGGGGGRGGRGGRGNLLFILIMAPIVLLMKLKEIFFGDGPGTAKERIFSREQIALRSSQTEKILASLAAVDPLIQPQLLETEVRSIFLAMQAAWEGRDYSRLQHRIAPELYNSHTSKVDQMLANSEKNMMEDVQVQAVDFIHVRFPENAQDRSVTALITASARDYVIDERSGSLVRGSRFTSTFQEFWTFRPQGGRWVPARIDQTHEDYILTAPNLPAAPLDAAAPVSKALNGPASVSAVPVLAAALPPSAAPQAPAAEQPRRFDSSGDPWDKQRMEIAATLAFLNVYGAWEKNKPEDLQADAIFPETLARLKALMAAREKEGLTFKFADLYTRKADIVLIERGAMARGGRDEFTARINASARRALSRGGKPLHTDAAPAPFTEYWVFARDNDKRWKFREILPRIKQEGGDNCQADVAPTPVQLEWYWQS
ncbi:MAG: TIM44-like domain-containing protein [Elusimicrobiales bacterium]|nr:TIM44-like domain-containing protein [Elusimicrobiales bacterium]